MDQDFGICLLRAIKCRPGLYYGGGDMSVLDFLMEYAPITNLVSSFLGATIAVFLGGYLRERGRQLAIRHDFEHLTEQLAENTTLTKSIESRLSQADWLGRSEFEYRCQQLSELYGPLYGYLKTTHDLYDLWTGGRLHDRNLDVKRLLAEQNDAIVSLVRSKVHLLDDGEMPPSLIRLITSSIVWNLYCSISEEGALPPALSSDERVRYPIDVIAYVASKTEEIKRRRDELYSRFAFPQPAMPR